MFSCSPYEKSMSCVFIMRGCDYYIIFFKVDENRCKFECSVIHKR